MIEKEDFKAFTLEVVVIPSAFSKYSHCFLEQYFLLDKRFNLNTHKIVNFRVNQGFKIYLYDKDYKTLYYSSISLNAFCADLGIHRTSYRKRVNKNELFLDHFIISNNLISEAVPTDLTELQVCALINKQRINSLGKLYKSCGSSVEVFDTDTNTTILFASVAKAASKFGISRSSVRNYISFPLRGQESHTNIVICLSLFLFNHLHPLRGTVKENSEKPVLFLGRSCRTTLVD